MLGEAHTRKADSDLRIRLSVIRTLRTKPAPSSWSLQARKTSQLSTVTCMARTSTSEQTEMMKVPVPDWLKLEEQVRAGRLVHATAVTLPDGKTLAFGSGQ